jgi:hypothetical protein
MTTTGKYYFTNSRRALKWDVTDIIGSGTVDPTNGKFLKFPKSILPTYTIFAVSNGGGLNYSINGADVGTNCNSKFSTSYSTGSTVIRNVATPLWATSVAFVLVGAGGGGGSGGRGVNAANGDGGAGGGSGGVLISPAIPLLSANDYINGLNVVVGNNGLGGVRAYPNDEPNILIDGPFGNTPSGGTNGGSGGDTTITINGNTYTAGGGGGGENGYNRTDSQAFSHLTASGGRGGSVFYTGSMQTVQIGTAASDVILGSDSGRGSGGSNGAGINVIPVNNYYSTITGAGGAAGAKGNNGNNPGIVGTGIGSGGGGGGGSTSGGGDFGGAGGNGRDGFALVVFYP